MEEKRFIPDLVGVRALVVDDNALACEILNDALKVFALSVVSVSSGEDALRELAAADSRDPYQVVFMDWHMPGMDGLEASRLIKRGHRLKHVPKIVMVTAFGREDIRTQAEEMGVEGYLLKPVSRSVLYDTLVNLFAVAAQEGGGLRAAREGARSHDARGIRVLLVEDNEVNQQVATELLESAGATVRIANHGGEAVKILTEGNGPPPFDVVLMDLQMPEVDGYTATKILRADPRLRGLPIIAMTAHAMVEERQRCFEAGMDDHVSKPIDPDALFVTLGRWAKPREVRGAGSRATPMRGADEVILPTIEGIDVADGLRRVAGNKRLYRELLAQFAEKQSDASAQLSAALESGDRERAERIAHTVKGVAGNIGISQLCSAAERLERAIREGDAAVPAFLGKFAYLLSRQVQLIQQALRDRTPARPERGESTEFDAPAASAAVARLQALLEASDGDALEAFVTLADVVAGRVGQAQLDALSAAISEFNFEGALLQLGEIAQACGVHGAQAK
jgi:CheY-like chemotaxis protein